MFDNCLVHYADRTPFFIIKNTCTLLANEDHFLELSKSDNLNQGRLLSRRSK